MKYNVKVFCEGQLVHEVTVEVEATASQDKITAVAMVTCKFMFRGRQATYEITKA